MFHQLAFISIHLFYIPSTLHLCNKGVLSIDEGSKLPKPQSSLISSSSSSSSFAIPHIAA